MVQNDTVLLSSTYFGPVQWYQKINRYPQVWIEQHEHFVKQTYRNRCIIPTTNGLQALSIPVTCPDNQSLSKTPFRDIRITDHGNWRHIHWNALCSAYGESPFFEYYQDDIRPFFEKKWDFLIDFNHAIMMCMLNLLDIEKQPQYTASFQPLPPKEAAMVTDSTPERTDFRNSIRPKHPENDPTFVAKPYYQVYQQKIGFQPNMSILDLLFNEGNEAVLWL